MNLSYKPIIRLSVIALLIVGIIVTVSLVSEKYKNGNAIEEGAGNPSQMAEGFSSQSDEIKNTQKSDDLRKIAKQQTVPKKVTRGENERLIFARPEVLIRKTIAGKGFEKRPFDFKNSNPLGELSLSQHSISAIDVSYEPAILKEFIDSSAEHFEVPVSEEDSVEVLISRVLSRGGDTLTLSGKVVDEDYSDVLLVFHDGVVSGSIAFYDTNTHYEFGVSGDGDIAIRHLDPDSFDAPCACHDHVEMSDETFFESAENSSRSFDNEQIQADAPSDSADNATVIDTVVGYGRQAQMAEGGVAAMEAKIIASVDRTNLAFSNSLINGIELVLAATIQDPDYEFPGDISGNMGRSDELGNLRSTSDGVLDTVTDLKRALGADHSAFIVRKTDGAAGIAGRPGASMVVARNYMTSTRITFVHELGHNIGCRHAWADSSVETATSTSAYGWRINSPDLGKVRSVMSYDWGWTRIPYFSNPAVLYGGARTGAVNGYDATGDPTADPRMVSGGFSGSGRSGYDGSNPNLGARNADLIQNNAQILANRSARSAAGIRVSAEGRNLVNGESTLHFDAGTITSEVSIPVVIRNAWLNSLDDIDITITGADANDFSLSNVGANTLGLNQSETFQISFLASGSDTSNATLRITSNSPANPVFEVQLEGNVRLLLNEESFEERRDISWVNTNSSFDWSRTLGSTASPDTGPSKAADGNYYYYTEATQNQLDAAYLEVELDFLNHRNIELKFAYHMYGSDMGNLYVDVFSEGQWDLAVWSRSGEQQSSSDAPWLLGAVNLSRYGGRENVKIRFRGEVEVGFASDMAIDDINVYAYPTVVLNDYTSWAGSYNLMGSDALAASSPLGDGVSNLWKYAFNINPSTFGAPIMEPATGVQGSPFIDAITEGTGKRLQVEYLRRKESADLKYYVQFSSDLGSESSWQQNGIEQQVIDLDQDWQRVTVEDSLSTGSSVKRFGRVKVELVTP